MKVKVTEGRAEKGRALTASTGNVIRKKDGSLRNTEIAIWDWYGDKEAVTGYQLGFTTREFWQTPDLHSLRRSRR